MRIEHDAVATIGSDILYAKQLLKAGALVAIPTETVYGLAGNAYDERAVRAVFRVKQRPFFNPLIVHAGSLEQVQRCVQPLPEKALRLADHCWPGPLTLLLEKKSYISDLVTAGRTSVAVRVPQHPLALRLLRNLDFPLVAPSANPFNYLSPTTAQHVQAQLGTKIPYILDGGACEIGIESTIVGFQRDYPVVYRLGGIDIATIKHLVGPVKVNHQKDQLRAITPGRLAHHYAPRKPLVMGELATLLKRYKADRVGVLVFQQPSPHISSEQQIVLAPSGNLEEAARNLFKALRVLDDLSVEVILASPVPDVGIGRAINDRLSRAATYWG